MRGVVAAGHKVTAEAGADVLRAGGNAVDAAVAAVLVSFASESLLTGPGAGGFMLLTSPSGRSHLLDFFVSAPGRGLTDPEPAPLLPVEVAFSPETIQIFNVGASSCGAYGTPAGLAYALERYGTMGLGDLTPAAAKAAREGVVVTPIQEYLLRILGPIFRSTPEGTALYEPDGHPVVAGQRLPMPELADLLDRLGAEGPDFLYRGDVADAISDWVLQRGGLLTADDLSGYQVVERAPVGADFRGRRVLTNPPPSSGGILIADALELLDRIDRPGHTETIAEVIAATNRARDHEFVEGLRSTDFVQQFLAPGALDRVAGEIGSRLGSTTHVSVMDADGGVATVTCSNGSSSGVVVPGTGMHLNNMMGEEDLNPAGFHDHPPGARVPSMMAPTVVLRHGQPEVALGSAGSNRIRSAIVQTIAAVVDGGLDAQAAVDWPRVHVEGPLVDAEPGVDEGALAALEARDWQVKRWHERNLYFGGVQAVVRDADGLISGGGDPRRGGAAISID